MKEVEQEVQVASAEEIVDFQPDVTHQVVPENKRQEAACSRSCSWRAGRRSTSA